MPDELTNEPSGTVTVPVDETAITTAQEPRQSEEVRRIQAAKDAEIARVRREADETKAQLEAMRQEQEALNYQVAQMQTQNIPDERARLEQLRRNEITATQRQIVTLQQRAAIAEARAEHPDLNNAELETLAKAAKSEREFKTSVEDLVKTKEKSAKDAEENRERLRKEIRAELEKEMGINRVSTATPSAGANQGPDADYERIKSDAMKSKRPELIIAELTRRSSRGGR